MCFSCETGRRATGRRAAPAAQILPCSLPGAVAEAQGRTGTKEAALQFEKSACFEDKTKALM